MPDEDDKRFVSRGGLKLEGALEAGGFSVQGLTVADFGSHAGGFVDCLLQHGAKRVYSVDTSYGTLAWKLRKDGRVVVMERTNAMHVELPEQVDVVTIDVGWTRQVKILPSAITALKEAGTIISLIKPHYEADPSMLVNGVLPQDEVAGVLGRVFESITELGCKVVQVIASPILGHGGNEEHFAILRMNASRSEP